MQDVAKQCNAGDISSLLPLHTLRHDMFWQCRVGEATHPGPAGKAAKYRRQRGITKPVTPGDIKKVCQDVLRAMKRIAG